MDEEAFATYLKEYLKHTQKWQYYDEKDMPEYEAEAYEPKVKSKIYNVDRIAETLMDELERNGLDSYIVLKDPEIGEWWNKIKTRRAEAEAAKRKAEAAKRKKEEDARAKKALLDRLTPEEKRLLGIKGK